MTQLTQGMTSGAYVRMTYQCRLFSITNHTQRWPNSNRGDDPTNTECDPTQTGGGDSTQVGVTNGGDSTHTGGVEQFTQEGD